MFSRSSDEDEKSLNDAITDQFQVILQDVTVYYTKKLDMYRIKMEHHQRTRPDKRHYEVAFVLMEIYQDHPNREELWKDMFCHLLQVGTPLQLLVLKMYKLSNSASVSS